MEYYPHTDLLLIALAGFVLCLMASVGTRRQKEQGEPPRWVEQANGDLRPRHLRRMRGYDPVVKPRIEYNVNTVDLGRMPKMGTIVPRGGYGNE